MFRPGVNHEDYSVFGESPIERSKAFFPGVHILGRWMDLKYTGPCGCAAVKLLNSIATLGVYRDSGDEEVRILGDSLEKVLIGDVDVRRPEVSSSLIVIACVLGEKYYFLDGGSP